MSVLILLWAFLRCVFALAGFVCLLLTVATLTGWFTVSAEGRVLEWYWLLAAAFMLGLIATIGDNPFRQMLELKNVGARSRMPPEWDDRDWERAADPEPELPEPLLSVGSMPTAMDLVWAMLVAGAWGGLTYVLGFDLIVIFPVAALVGIGFALRRAGERGKVEKQEQAEEDHQFQDPL